MKASKEIAKKAAEYQKLKGKVCDQVMLGEDYGSGTYYIPIEGSSEYLFVTYSF